MSQESINKPERYPIWENRAKKVKILDKSNNKMARKESGT